MSVSLCASAAEIDAAAALLRAAGWTCIPPVSPGDVIPEPATDQVWISPKRGVEPRTVVRVGSHRAYPGTVAVFFTTPTRPGGEYGPPALPIKSWEAWVRKSGARPSTAGE